MADDVKAVEILAAVLGADPEWLGRQRAISISIEAARSAIETALRQPAPVWRDIATAPKDVSRCLLWCSDYATFKRSSPDDEAIKMGRITEGRPYGDGMNGDWKFSHYAFLPPPPAPETPHG